MHKQKDLPTAFLAGNDLSAIGVTKAIEHAGYHVPNDFNVVGFDGIELLKYFRPSLAGGCRSLKLPKEQGELATQHLVKLINGDVSGKSFVLNGRLVEGESVYQFNRNE